MFKLIPSAIAALALFCGSASVQAQQFYPRAGHNHGHPNYGHNHGSYYNNNHHHHHHHHHGSYYGNYGRPSYYPVYPATPYYTPGNYLGLQLGNFGLSIGSTPYVAPYQGNYYRGY